MPSSAPRRAHAVRSRKARRPGTVQALERGLGILGIIAERGRLPLADIARRGGLHLSTTHHLVKTLEGLGYVRQAGDRTYCVAGGVFRLAAAAWNEDELAKLAEPAVTDLGLKTGEATQLAVFDRHEVTVISKLDVGGPGRRFERLGMPRPAYCTALGKALLAFQGPSVLADYLARVELRRFTPKTITTRARLEQQLREVRRRGWAIDDEEFSQGIRCFAAPVCNFSGKVVAALGFFGAAWRLGPDRQPAVVATLLEMAEHLSRQLAYSGPYPPAPPEDR